MRYVQLVLFIFLTILTNGVLAKSPQIPGSQLKLGEVQFDASSTSPIAKAHFLLGLKYLHNFMYPLALREFKLAEEADPHLVMSYWGQAMCYKWSLWSYENKIKGKQVFKDYRKRRNVKTSPLEKGFIDAIAEIYKPGKDLANKKKYIAAMRKLYEKFPKNPDVASFYALVLIDYALDAPYDKEGVVRLAQARLILKSFIDTYPAHPGILHYYMRVNDIPNSPYLYQGLTVTKNVYDYMRDSSHVLNMPSHLYAALGRWPEAAKANALSVKASHKICRFLQKAKINLDAVDDDADDDDNVSSKKFTVWTPEEWYACDADNVYHALEWQQYAYLQMGEFKKAQDLLDEMQKVAKLEPQNSYDFWAYRMLARQILYSQVFDPVVALPKPLMEFSQDKNWAAYSECGILLATGISAVKNNQMGFFDAIDERYTKILSQLKSSNSEEYKDACKLAHAEVLAYKYAYIDDDYDASTDELDRVQKIQDKLQSSRESLTLPFLPAQEVYGDIMIKKSKYWPKILKLYQNELQYYPNRTLALEGLEKIKRLMR